MNKAILMGRLTREPEIRYSNGPEQTAVGGFTLAVDRRGQRQGNQQNADFIPCVAFGKKAEFVEKYTHKGTKVIVEGEIRTGTRKNGVAGRGCSRDERRVRHSVRSEMGGSDRNDSSGTGTGNRMDGGAVGAEHH